MQADEAARHALHTKLEEILGAEPATTLMSYLPPVGWTDVATKRDLDALEERLETRFETTLHRELNGQSRTLFFSVLASNATMAGLVFAAVKIV